MSVEEGGKWYVSPVRTLLDNGSALLATITPQQVEEIITDIEQLVPSASHIATKVRL
jgi:hypothetical protein